VTGKDCVILHTAASNGDSLQAWFNNPSAQASSHFYVRKSGVVEQYIDSKYMSWANVQGNPRSVTIETEGLGDEAWTAKQVQAIVALCQWACKTHGIPVRQMASSAVTEKGIGWHRLGCDGNYPTTGILRGRNQRGGGQDWTGAAGYGRACPGDKRIEQMPGIIAAVSGKKVKVAKAKPQPLPHMVSPIVGWLSMPWHGYANHAGMDIATVNAAVGVPVRAAFAGTVKAAVMWSVHGNLKSTWAPGRTGNGCLIENSDGEAQGYNHMRPTVKVGQRVKQGDVIGYNDRSGNQSGPHLHFECWPDADDPYTTYDPQRCFNKYGVTVGSAPVIAATQATTIVPEEDNTMKYANGLTRNKDQSYGPNAARSVRLNDKDTISLATVRKGDTIRAEAQVYVTGLKEGEVVDLRWILVDWKKGTTKVVGKYPIKHITGRGHGAVVADEISVTAKIGRNPAAGYSQRLRLHAHNRGTGKITITQVRATLERN
jgi:murein DD-endopeptidase MepM/ murein hydrolase activator NlpD